MSIERGDVVDRLDLPELRAHRALGGPRGELPGAGLAQPVVAGRHGEHPDGLEAADGAPSPGSLHLARLEPPN